MIAPLFVSDRVDSLIHWSKWVAVISSLPPPTCSPRFSFVAWGGAGWKEVGNWNLDVRNIFVELVEDACSVIYYYLYQSSNTGIYISYAKATSEVTHTNGVMKVKLCTWMLGYTLEQYLFPSDLLSISFLIISS